MGENRHLAYYLANRLGYWYFIKGAEIPECISGSVSFAKFHIENKGFSKAYNRYDLLFFSISENGNVYKLTESSPDNTKWEGETTTIETIKLDFRNVPVGKYKLCAKMLYGEMPIKLGIRGEYMLEDGGYIIDTIEVKDF